MKIHYQAVVRMNHDAQTLIGQTNLDSEYSRGWVTQVSDSPVFTSFYFEKNKLVRTLKFPVSALIQYSEFRSDEPNEEIE